MATSSRSAWAAAGGAGLARAGAGAEDDLADVGLGAVACGKLEVAPSDFPADDAAAAGLPDDDALVDVGLGAVACGKLEAVTFDCPADDAAAASLPDDDALVDVGLGAVACGKLEAVPFEDGFDVEPTVDDAAVEAAAPPVEASA